MKTVTAGTKINPSPFGAVVASALMIAGLMLVGDATASPTYCSGGADHPEGLNETDVSFGVSGTSGYTRNSDDCFGIVTLQGSGGVGDAAITSYLNDNDIWRNDWTFLVRDEGSEASSSFDGNSFTLDAGTGANQGTWTLSWGGSGLPKTFDFAVILKAARPFAAYYFDDLLITADPLTGTGTFEIAFENNGGNNPALSFFGLLIADPKGFANGNGGGTPGGNGNEIPEPATLALFGGGLLGLGWMMRRRNRVDHIG